MKHLVFPMRRPVAAAASLLIAASGAMLITATPAHAAGAFDLYALHSPGLHVNSNSCRDVQVTAKTTADPTQVEDIWATVDVWRGNKQIDNLDLEPVNGDVDQLAGQYYYCPYLDGVGRFRLGSTEVEWYDVNYNDTSFVDDTTGGMVIKQATRDKFSATRSGARRTFYSHASFFAVGYGWSHFPKGYRVTLQRRPADGSGAWKSIQSQRTNKRGNTTYIVRAAKKHQYRVVRPSTTRSWNLVGPVLTK